MNDEQKPQFPLLLRDRQGFIYVINSIEELVTDIEPEFIEDGEFIAWDAICKPVGLELIDGLINLSLLSKEPETQRVRNLILRLADRFRPGVEFTNYNSNTDVFELYKRVDDFAKEGSLRNRIKKWFKETFWGSRKGKAK